MINKKNILTPLSALAQSNVSFDKRLIYPVRDWLLGLSFFCMLVLLGVAQSAHTFVTYRNITVEGGSSEEIGTHYNQELVQKTLTAYGERARALEELRDSIVPPENVPDTQTATSSEGDTGDAEAGQEIGTSSAVLSH